MEMGKLKTVEIYTNINNIKLTRSSISYHFFVETLMIITHLSFITILKHFLRNYLFTFKSTVQ